MPERVAQITMLALAGALGTLARVGASAAAQRLLHDRLTDHPMILRAAGTLAVNVAGSFLFGLIWCWLEPAASEGPPAGESESAIEIRVLILAGFLGAFTTFSAFSFETGRFLKDGHLGLATTNIGANLVLGLAGLLAGLWIGQRL